MRPRVHWQVGGSQEALPSLPAREGSNEMSDQTEGERCSACGRPYLTIYRVPDDIWAKVTGRTDGGGTWCPTCFEFVATEKGYSLYWEARHGEFPLEAVKARDAVAKTLMSRAVFWMRDSGTPAVIRTCEAMREWLAASEPPGTARQSLGEEGT